MNKVLQVILIISSTLFFVFIFNMVRNKRLELKYALTWMLTSFSFIILSVFPEVLYFVSAVLHIELPVNTLFLSVIFFLLVIVFTLTIALSRNANRVKTLTQEIGILKLKIEKLSEVNKE
ncbi:MAG: DUF2304 domain-containing protein [Clostridia bacterium]|nr:DUF2304 domain-containing protein [Clostridia bacterium]